jgi:hypothetical protein
MSFEKDFPSLCKFFTEDKMPIPEVFYISVVEQCCLDKQKVREAIEKGEIMILDHPAKDKEKAYYLMALQDIRNELGFKGE